MNINQFLKLKIQGKLAIAFAGLSILPVVIVGILGISANVSSLQRLAIENLHHDLLTTKERVAAFFQVVEDNVHTLAASSAFQRFIRGVNTDNASLILDSEKDLFPEISKLARRKGFFYQIKFIDPRGDEIFTFEKGSHGFHFLPPEKLNRYGTSFYLYVAQKNPANKATFIPVELHQNTNDGLFPAISCIYPIYQTDFCGVLIFHIDVESFFNILELPSPRSPAGKVALVNASGYYLYHSEKKKNRDQLLASRETENLYEDYGAVIAKQLLSRKFDSIHEIGNELIAHAPIFTNYSGFGNEYTILKSVTKAQINTPVAAFEKLFLGILGFFLLTSLILSYLATRQLTDPVRKLRRETEKIASGDYQSRVEVQTYDEIAELAQQFNAMAEALEQRDNELAQHREHLEQMVQARTKELKDEKNKLQAILDNVPSGFILLNRNFRILAASAELEKITGKPVHKLLGQHCYEAIGDSEDCAKCPSAQSLISGRVESRLVKRMSIEGEERYYEQISVPLKSGRHVNSILEMMTDVTERIRLQDQLIRSERLATTGEIAAYVAHEMRNSLTSIHMLLQLLSEVDYLKPSDRESLDVALNSFGRIERVVNDLLQLARPAKLHKRPERINEIIKASVDFTGHQIAKKGIALDLNLAANVPEILLDREQMKEAFVNLILNATQAIENTGRIRIRSTYKKLEREMRELGEVRRTPTDSETIDVREIILKKETKVICVEIADTGMGIPEEYVQRIFDPFFTTKADGTGLGLSFVKRVVNEHGGLISVISKTGESSLFTLFLPLSENA